VAAHRQQPVRCRVAGAADKHSSSSVGMWQQSATRVAAHRQQPVRCTVAGTAAGKQEQQRQCWHACRALVATTMLLLLPSVDVAPLHISFTFGKVMEK
jgi:hypothetical protein